MADLWSAMPSIYGLSTTSGTRFARANHVSTVDEARAMLLSAVRTHGWGGLENIATDALTSLGTLRRFNAGVITQDEHMYVYQFICYVLVGVLYGHSDSLISPGVLRDISSDFARTGRSPLAINPLSLPEEDGTTGNPFTILITTTATVVIALVRHIDGANLDVTHAFQRFAQNPTSWAQYNQPNNTLSVEDIARLVHRGVPPAHIRAVDATLRPPNESHHEGTHSSLVIGILAFFNISIWSSGSTTDVDIEAGIGGFILQDGEVEYIAVLFVAALMRFHAGPGSNTSQHAR